MFTASCAALTGQQHLGQAQETFGCLTAKCSADILSTKGKARNAMIHVVLQCVPCFRALQKGVEFVSGVPVGDSQHETGMGSIQPTFSIAL